MRKPFAVLFSMMLGIGVFALSSVCGAADAEPVLKTVQRAVSAELNRLDAGLQEAARRLGASGLVGEDARSALKELCSKYPYAVDCAAVDPRGTMMTIEPAPFRMFEGTDISAQSSETDHENRRPRLSSVFRAVEGFPAVDAEYPVTGPMDDAWFCEHPVSPRTTARSIIARTIEGMPVDIGSWRKGGLILYDVDTSQVGLNLFAAYSMTLYGTHHAWTSHGGSSEGEGVYTFHRGTAKDIVTKRASWQTVSLFVTEWRLVAIHVERADPRHNRHCRIAGTCGTKAGILAKSTSL
jgi:hypothetical protein